MEFYVVVLQWRQKSVLKSEVRAELLFVLLKIPFFFNFSRSCRRRCCGLFTPQAQNQK